MGLEGNTTEEIHERGMELVTWT